MTPPRSAPPADGIPDTCLVDDLARILQTSRATIDRRRKSGVFPIPELPAIDKRPRWSGAAVRRFLSTGQTGSRLLRRVS